MRWWDQMPWSSFSECWVLCQLFPLCFFTFIKRLFSSSLLSVIVVFILSAFWWIRGLWKFPDGRDWLWRNLGLVLIGGAMLSKSLIQFSVDGRGFVPSCCLAWGQTIVGVQFSSVSQSCPTIYDPMDCSTPGLPIHHQLPEFTQTHVHWVSDAIQPSHPLSSPSPPAPNPSQHRGLFQWVNSSHEVAKILEFQLQHQSFQRTPRTDLL